MLVKEEILYSQFVYRKLLNAMGQPGTVAKIQPVPFMNTEPYSPYLVGVAMTLLDQEVTFHIVGEDKSFASYLRLYTLAKESNMEDCDYLVVKGKADFNPSLLKRGTLAYPDRSATLLCLLDRLSDQPLEGFSVIRIKLKGPGIPTEREIYLDSLYPEVMIAWEESNQEYPLGIDWVFIDKSGNICCVPRTSELNWEVL